MNIRPQTLADPEDMFNDTRMSFGEHIEELRTHLLRAGFGLVIGVLISLPFSKYVLEFIAKPVQDELMVYWNRYYEEKKTEIVEAINKGEKINGHDLPMPKSYVNVRELAEKLNLPFDNIDPKERIVAAPDPEEYATQWIKITLAMKPPALATLSVQEAFMVYMMVCLGTGLVVSSPWVFYQLWSFIAAGLYPQEKRLINVYLPYSVILFVAGVILCELVAIPKAIHFLLLFNEWLGLQPDLRLSEWLTFAIFMPLLFGLSFQLPLVMLFAGRIGVVDANFFRARRRVAIFIICACAVILVPSPDLVSCFVLGGALCLLYELGIWMCAWHERSDVGAGKTSDSEEMVEV